MADSYCRCHISQNDVLYYSMRKSIRKPYESLASCKTFYSIDELDYDETTTKL